MKPMPLIASATVTALCCFYLVQLDNRAEAFASNDAPLAVSAYEETAPSSYTMTPPTEVALNQRAQSRIKSKTKRSYLNIDNTISNRVGGKEGTVLYFPANSFVDAKGNIIEGEVRIRLDECYSVADMLQAKLSTTSGSRLLETAGMVDIQATCNGKQAYLRDGAAYNIYFPKNGNVKDDFQLFYGEWNKDGIIDWVLAENDEPIEEETWDESQWNGETWMEELEELESVQPRQSLLSDDEACFIQIEKSHIRRGYKINNMDYFNWKLANGQTMNQWFVSNFNPDIEMLEAFCVNGYRSEIQFKVDRNGLFKSYYVWNSNAIREYDRVLADFLKTMPALELDKLMPTYTDDHSCILTFSSMKGNDRQNFVQQFKSKNKAGIENPLQNVEASSLDYFVYSATELGWINCDRFYDSEQPLVDYYVMSPPSAAGSVSMIFDDINSIVKGVHEGDKVVFRGIPSMQKVRLVGIDVVGTSPMMCVENANTHDRSSELTAYKPFSINELEKTFSKQYWQ